MTIDNPVLRRGAAPRIVHGVLIAALLIAVMATVLALIASVAGLLGLGGTTVPALLETTEALPDRLVTGRVVSGVFETAALELRDLPAGITALSAGAGAAGMLARLALGAGFVLLLTAVLRRRPFTARTSLWIGVAGGIAMIASLLEAGLAGLRDMATADLLNGGSVDGPWPLVAVFDPTAVGIGFGLMVVGLLFAHGDELQRTTDGLV